MKKARYPFIFFLLLTYCLPAQEFISIEHGCNYDEEETEKEYVLLDASSEAQRIVMEILEANSMFYMPFILKEANVKNAQATFANKNKYILYSPVFLENFKKEAKTRWAAYSVLAHEIGHHIYGHDFTETNSQKRKTSEIQADNFSGSIMRKLGATFDEAQAGINTFALEGETNTHPSKSMRSTAIANGWKRQDDVLKGRGETETLTNQPDKEEVDREMAKAKQYLDNKDYTKAFPIYYKYRNSPYFSSDNESNLGYMYEKGTGVQQDDDEALKWYRKSAEQGNAIAQNNLGYMYQKGTGVQQDYDEALKWYRKSAEQGNASGQSNLGIMYYNGTGVQQDDDEAVKWYRKSAEQGNASGQGNLGIMYYNGTGVQQDYYEALKWFRKAAEQGNANGQLGLGAMYELGFGGLQKNISEAVRLYRLAAAQGNEYAKTYLKRLGYN